MIYMNIHMDLKIVHDLHYYFFYVTFSRESWNVLRLIVSIWYLFEWALWFHEFFLVHLLRLQYCLSVTLKIWSATVEAVFYT